MFDFLFALFVCRRGLLCHGCILGQRCSVAVSGRLLPLRVEVTWLASAVHNQLSVALDTTDHTLAALHLAQPHATAFISHHVLSGPQDVQARAGVLFANSKFRPSCVSEIERKIGDPEWV